MERRMSVAEAQEHFDEVLAYVVETQQAVIVECNGVDQAVIMSFEARANCHLPEEALSP